MEGLYLFNLEIIYKAQSGVMAEWSIALPWKGSNWVTGSGVRIPVSPP